MKPTRIINERKQSAPATCRAWQYHDDTPTCYVRCDTPLHMEVSSQRIIIACPWHPDRIYPVLPEEPRRRGDPHVW